ncbi:unnamed protein product [Linum trigynum]|uniref:Cystatin domain-containing protein n=1 Tax=Linum trigynum TaxID=586398 RepID=A0AAV2EK94_9ROSI
MRPITILVAIASVAIVLLAAEAVTGGWQPIKNLKDKHVREIAEFAVITYDSGLDPRIEPLKLVSVDGGETQIVEGTNYKLLVTATPANESVAAGGDMYQAIVYESLSNVKKLVSFIPWD